MLAGVDGRLPKLLIVSGAVALFIFSTAALPEKADAWTWKNTCSIDTYNHTTDTIRMVSWAPLPPDPEHMVLFTVNYAVKGLEPGKRGMLVANTGFPFPSYGCSGTLTYFWPHGQIRCAYVAPTTGKNRIVCGAVAGTGGYRIEWHTDTHDLYVTVHLYETKSGGHQPPPRNRPPSHADRLARNAALRHSELPGAGWQSTSRANRLGRLGQLWMQGHLARACRRGGPEPAALGTGGSLFTRAKGRSLAGSTVGIFRTRSDASRMLHQSLSAASAGCLAQLLGSAPGRLRAQTRSSRLRFAGLGVRTAGFRITIRRRAAPAFTGYLDLVGLQAGKRWALVVFYDEGRAMPPASEQRALRAVAHRIA